MEAANIPPQHQIASYVVMGIPVQLLSQKIRVRNLMVVALVWSFLVLVDQTSQLAYTVSNFQQTRECYENQTLADTEGGSEDLTLIYITFIPSVIVGAGIPLLGYFGALRRYKAHINVSVTALCNSIYDFSDDRSFCTNFSSECLHLKRPPDFQDVQSMLLIFFNSDRDFKFCDCIPCHLI